MTRVRVRRERPTALAWAVALCVTMLAVYVLTLGARRPDVVESMADAPRVTRQLEFDRLEGWCVTLADCDTAEQARLQASAYVNRGAAGCVTRLEDAWVVVGAVYDRQKEAERVASRLSDDEGIPARAVRLESEGVTLRITAQEALIEAVSGADALLRRQAAQLGDVALQLDRGEVGPEAARTLCALAATEAAQARQALLSVPAAAENGLCAALARQLDALAGQQQAVSDDVRAAGATLSGMLRCAQAECFLGQLELLGSLRG